MITKVEMFDVKFGDCFICSDGADVGMLVDCGSHRSGNVPHTAIDSALGTFKERYLMISHFHADHINGVGGLSSANLFSKVFLPNFFNKESIQLQFAALLLGSVESNVHRTALRLLLTIPAIANHLTPNSDICFLKRGDVPANKLDGIRILWPERNTNRARAQSILNDVPVKLKEVLSETADKYYEVLNSYRGGDPGTDLGDTLVIRKGDREGLLSLEKLVNDFAERNKEFKKGNGGMGLRRQISSFQNEISLCFDNALGKSDDKKYVLFLGDTHKRGVETIAKSKAANLSLLHEYHAIKVPHHGTRDYFTTVLPKSEILLISNGNGTQGREISMRYGEYYQDRAFCCSNYHRACEYALVDMQCPAARSGRAQCGFPGSSVTV